MDARAGDALELVQRDEDGQADRLEKLLTRPRGHGQGQGQGQGQEGEVFELRSCLLRVRGVVDAEAVLQELKSFNEELATIRTNYGTHTHTHIHTHTHANTSNPQLHLIHCYYHIYPYPSKPYFIHTHTLLPSLSVCAVKIRGAKAKLDVSGVTPMAEGRDADRALEDLGKDVAFQAQPHTLDRAMGIQLTHTRTHTYYTTHTHTYTHEHTHTYRHTAQ